MDYPCTPNVCNLDAHVKREGLGRVWPEGGVWSEEGPAYRLRWVTLGYHYDWDTKVEPLACELCVCECVCECECA